MDIAKRARLEVLVKKITPRGVWVEIPGRSAKGWVPSSEWSRDSAEWRRDRGRLWIGQRVLVIEWGRSLASGEIALSKRRADFDPWEGVDSNWIGSIRFFKVTRLTRSHAIGDIEPGLQGRISRDAFDRYLSSRRGGEAWESHKVITLGDVVGGIVCEIIYPHLSAEPEVVLNAEELLGQFENNLSLLASTELAPLSRSSKEINETFSGISPLVLEHILVVDDDREFLSSVTHALSNWGFKVYTATSSADATELLRALEPDMLQLGLIDVHLVGREDVHDGLAVAQAIKDRHAHCKVVLVSGEDIGVQHGAALSKKVHDAGDLAIAMYLPKPFTVEELQTEITKASNARERTLAEVISEFTQELAPAPFNKTLADLRSSDYKSTYRYSPSGAIEELAKQLPGTVLHIFEMNPIDNRVRSIAHSGDGLNWERVRHKLAKSPVGDTTIDPNRKTWIASDVLKTSHLRGKHFWLLEAMTYRSALGIPIRATSPMAYCLIALHERVGAFLSEFILQAELCAERAARALEWEWLMKQSEERSRFEKAGMGFAFLAHELRGILTTIDTDAYVLAELLAEASPESDAQKLELLSSLRQHTERAVKAARTLTGVRGVNPREKVDVLECLDGAIRSVLLQMPSEGEIEIKLPPPSEKAYVTRGDRASITLAMFNLLLNSVQQISLFPRARGIIWCEWARLNDAGSAWIRIDFSDSGPGIHAANKEQIFDIGFTTRPDGTGMGLHICRQIVESVTEGARKGRLEITRSILNIGTTFSIYLPANEV